MVGLIRQRHRGAVDGAFATPFRQFYREPLLVAEPDLPADTDASNLQKESQAPSSNRRHSTGRAFSRPQASELGTRCTVIEFNPDEPASPPR